jgi:hypothetical protein
MGHQTKTLEFRFNLVSLTYQMNPLRLECLADNDKSLGRIHFFSQVENPGQIRCRFFSFILLSKKDFVMIMCFFFL